MKCEITLGTHQYASESEFRCKSVMQMKSANDKIQNDVHKIYRNCIKGARKYDYDLAASLY